MNTTNQNSPFSTKPKKKVNNNLNFVEALKSIGGDTVKSVKNDLVKPIGSDFLRTMTGVGPNQAPKPIENSFQNQFDQYKPDWMKQREEEIKQQEAAKRRHQEIVNAKPIFDRRQEEVKQQIEALRKELQALAREIAGLGTSIQKAVEEEVVNPGTYHVSYFEQLRKFLVNLRKQVKESSSWMQVSSQRNKAKGHYWGQVKKSGTKFMLSSERNVVTQTG